MTNAIVRDQIYRGRRFQPEIIELCVRWYLTYRLSYRDRMVGRNPWQPNDEISQMDYFGRYELSKPMGLGARTRIIDALDGVTGVMRIIPRPHASVREEATTLDDQ